MNSSFYTDFLVNNKMLYIADYERKLSVYNLSDLLTCLKVIELGTWILCMNIDNNYIYAGTDNHMIRLYDKKTY